MWCTGKNINVPILDITPWISRAPALNAGIALFLDPPYVTERMAWPIWGCFVRKLGIAISWRYESSDTRAGQGAFFFLWRMIKALICQRRLRYQPLTIFLSRWCEVSQNKPVLCISHFRAKTNKKESNMTFEPTAWQEEKLAYSSDAHCLRFAWHSINYCTQVAFQEFTCFCMVQDCRLKDSYM